MRNASNSLINGGDVKAFRSQSDSMDTDSNPYASPVSSEFATRSSPSQQDAMGVDFVPIMRRWERLRLFYNLPLVLLVLVLTFVVFPYNASDIEYWLSIALGGLIANFCYLSGPTIEAYGKHLRLWNSILTTLLFLAGLGFTAVLAISCIASYPNV